MIRRRTKKGMAATVLAIVAVVGAGTAAATHVFDDVLDGAFYADAVEWAADNDITAGTTATTFHPERDVTRGESVTFLGRYDSNVVQPALGGMYTKAEVDAAVAGATDLLGGMRFGAIDVRIARGETGVLGSLDGATISMECREEFGTETDVWIYVESTLDGWYMDFDSSSVLMASDRATFVDTFEFGPVPDELAGNNIDGFNVITANGGYMGIGGETSTFILNPTVDPADCIFRGVLQWSAPPA